MATDATLQIQISDTLKDQVESLYRSMGTSFAEATRIFAQQSLREGGMPFRPSLKAWENMSEHEISERLLQSKSDIAANRICSLRDLDEKNTKDATNSRNRLFVSVVSHYFGRPNGRHSGRQISAPAFIA